MIGLFWWYPFVKCSGRYRSDYWWLDVWSFKSSFPRPRTTWGAQTSGRNWLLHMWCRACWRAFANSSWTEKVIGGPWTKARTTPPVVLADAEGGTTETGKGFVLWRTRLFWRGDFICGTTLAPSLLSSQCAERSVWTWVGFKWSSSIEKRH